MNDAGKLVWGFEDGVNSYPAPGRPLVAWVNPEGDPPEVVCDKPESGGRGPDGDGEDRLIKSAEQFNDCLGDVVEHFTRLESVGWCCAVTQMPVRACQALAKLENFDSLFYLIGWRYSSHLLSLWKCTSQVRSLTLGVGRQVLPEPDDQVQEQDEESGLHSSCLYKHPRSLQAAAKDALHTAILVKTIISAARGGNLRRIKLDEVGGLQYPFDIRALLCYWVCLEDYEDHWKAEFWEGAARVLRPLLAHASRWLQSSSSTGAMQDRRLTLQDVQQLRAKLNTSVRRIIGFSNRVYTYLQWLEEDTVLAEQVADAWAAIVERREAELVECPCGKCGSEESDDVGSDDDETGEAEATGVFLFFGNDDEVSVAELST